MDWDHSPCCCWGKPRWRRMRSGALGLFEGQSDVGSVIPPGTTNYNPATGVYTLTAAGANTWYHVDDFHYLWKKASGDIAISADIAFPPHSYPHDPNPHRKGILVIRQTLDAGGHASAGVHGSGLTALQYRRERGANSQDIELNIDAPRTVRLEKRGDTITLLLSMTGEPVHPVGAAIRLHFREPFYVGLGVVSHEVDTTDKVEFSHVTLQPLAPGPGGTPLVLNSTLQTVQTEDQFRRAMMIRTVAAYMQSANWAPDGKSIYVHEAGRIVKIPYLTPEAGGTPQGHRHRHAGRLLGQFRPVAGRPVARGQLRRQQGRSAPGVPAACRRRRHAARPDAGYDLELFPCLGSRQQEPRVHARQRRQG